MSTKKRQKVCEQSDDGESSDSEDIMWDENAHEEFARDNEAPEAKFTESETEYTSDGEDTGNPDLESEGEFVEGSQSDGDWKDESGETSNDTAGATTRHKMKTRKLTATKEPISESDGEEIEEGLTSNDEEYDDDEEDDDNMCGVMSQRAKQEFKQAWNELLDNTQDDTMNSVSDVAKNRSALSKSKQIYEFLQANGAGRVLEYGSGLRGREFADRVKDAAVFEQQGRYVRPERDKEWQCAATGHRSHEMAIKLQGELVMSTSANRVLTLRMIYSQLLLSLLNREGHAEVLPKLGCLITLAQVVGNCN